jgi:hypothetical protein
MKAFFQCLLLCLILALSSCSTTEEIWINKDNTVKREVKMDMGAIVPFLQMGDMFGEEEGESDEYSIEDEMDKEVEQGGDEAEAEKSPNDWMMELFQREQVDTLIEFRSFMEEEIKKQGITEKEFLENLAEEGAEEYDEEQKEMMMEMVQSLLKSSLRIKVDAPNEVYFFSIIQDFADAKELNAGANMMNGISTLMGDDIGESADPEQAAMMKMMMGGSPVYNLTKKEFSISRNPVDMSDVPEDIKASLTMMQAFMGGMEYQYIIHVPKKVKKINVNGAVINGNTVTFDVPMPKFGKGEDKGMDIKLKYK